MEQKAKEKAKEASSSPVSPASSGRRRREPTDAAEQGDAEETAAEVSPQAPSGEHSAGLGGFASPRSQEEHDLLDVSPYVELVTKVLEGLRGDTFLMAKDLGLNALMDVGPPTGLELLVERIKEHVFPLRSHEARELFRLGQQANGPLSRQSAETILSFIGRRKRWWIQLKELGNGQKSSQEFMPHGDELWWIETAKMLADALTKSMRPDLLVRVVQTGRNSMAWTQLQMRGLSHQQE